MIEVNELRKSYDEVEALRGVSFSVKSGEIIGLLGPNGAGKTTLMKILTGYLHPTSGTAKVGGLDVLEHTSQVQEMIGYLPENAPIYPELTVQSYLDMISDLRRIPKEEKLQSLSEAIHAVGLETRLTRPIGTLSKGYRQRVGLAQAILHRPRLLVLDEPTNGLDPTQIVEVRHLIKKLAEQSTVLISTHILSEVEATCDRAIIIMNGELKADADLAHLSATTDAIVGMDKKVERESVSQELTKLENVKKVEIADEANGHITFRVLGSTDQNLCPAIYNLVKEKDWPLVELKKEVRNLESVFNELAAAAGGVQ